MGSIEEYCSLRFRENLEWLPKALDWFTRTLFKIVKYFLIIIILLNVLPKESICYLLACIVYYPLIGAIFLMNLMGEIATQLTGNGVLLGNSFGWTIMVENGGKHQQRQQHRIKMRRCLNQPKTCADSSTLH